mmetsp:Transcript_91893/g.230998  ORF Transcript_91893/g.230998 Transcript_91893/m.230998 type:complete len:316 (-) Transcript_91893:265-1212(-)
MQSIKKWCEKVSVVVAPLLLQDGCHALQTHTGVNMLVWQFRQLSRIVAIELHENQIPNLNNIWIIRVYQRGSIPATNAVVVKLSARTARAYSAHLPEVIALPKRKYAGRWQVPFPELFGFQVWWEPHHLITAKVRRIDPFRLECIHRSEQLPSEVNGFDLEVIAKAPIAKHLKEGVVVVVAPDIIQVIVLATSTDAFLAVGGPSHSLQWAGRVQLAHEDCFELVHACIGKQQSRVVQGYDRTRRHEVVLLLLHEEIYVGFSYTLCGPFERFCGGRWLCRVRGCSHRHDLAARARLPACGCAAGCCYTADNTAQPR